MISEELRIIDIITVVVISIIFVTCFFTQMDTYLIRSDLRSIQRALDAYGITDPEKKP